ncbi:TlyA family RNA methyltransferase [Microbacterium album]|uniref:TlyA family rRNA (Cytidine-2'-O)-methyltransferase n=1 Tax=Microbacterium album TaxID=2053191 RepID=A0A917MM44_9MICO|nr:TlyA family RNA methyltransferase [Microbacterium album]GGH46136.1 TlyA family rRNA (cytidine-2'-O)-methyltransferase [Microbacterium album]
MSSRLDSALAARGLARSRTHAAALIEAGRVLVGGRVAAKASLRVDAAADITVTALDHYVSRAAHKLVRALDGFGIDPAGRVALDMGASTGGFTQVLRERDAEPVLAVDVGHGQLAPQVALDAEVRVVEGFNVRHMTAETLAAASGVTAAPSVITGDLSFISLTHVLPAVARVAAPDADVVLLVKPQFEVGRTRVRGGVVTDPGLRSDAVTEVLFSARDAGMGTLGVLASPIQGTHGNVEVLVHVAPGRGSDPTEWKTTIDRCCAGGADGGR